jgi:hypothetical protein
MTTTDPSRIVSTKCLDSLGAETSDDITICTVYAGPHIRVLEAEGDDGDGENMLMSGI